MIIRITLISFILLVLIAGITGAAPPQQGDVVIPGPDPYHPDMPLDVGPVSGIFNNTVKFLPIVFSQ